MQISIAAIGKCKDPSEKALVERYTGPCGWPVHLHELTPKKNGKTPEGEALLKQLQGCERIIALDERGRSLTSPQFAHQLQDWQDEGIRSIGFCIGGADGLSDAVRQRANLSLNFGAMVWPHMLVRVMLAEQLYRAWSITQGHPYHRM